MSNYTIKPWLRPFPPKLLALVLGPFLVLSTLWDLPWYLGQALWSWLEDSPDIVRHRKKKLFYREVKS